MPYPSPADDVREHPFDCLSSDTSAIKALLVDAQSLTVDYFCNWKSPGLMHLNIHCLLPELAELSAYVLTANPDILVLYESFQLCCFHRWF